MTTGNLIRFPNESVRAVTPLAVPEDRAVFRKVFDGTPGDDFSAFYAAVVFLEARGFTVGPGSIGNPCGIMYGRDWQIAKWKNLTAQEKAQLHGALSGDRRRGPVTVAIFFHAPAFAIAAVAVPEHADAIITARSKQR